MQAQDSTPGQHPIDPTQDPARLVIRLDSLMDLNAALVAFSSAFGAGYGSYLADDVATKLSCTEVEALAGVLIAIGDEETAAQWIAVHATDDDGGDMHGPDEDDETPTPTPAPTLPPTSASNGANPDPALCSHPAERQTGTGGGPGKCLACGTRY